MFERTCKVCGKTKLLREFFGPQEQVNHSRVCYSCRMTRLALRKQRRPKKTSLRPIRAQFCDKHRYLCEKVLNAEKITVVRYLAGIRAQEYKCAACGKLMESYLLPDRHQRRLQFICHECHMALQYLDHNLYKALSVARYLGGTK